MSGIKLVVFDFDLTLSTFNILEANAGWGEYAKVSPPPFAITELGQMRRMEILSRTKLRGAGGFALMHFGGHARTEKLRHLFEVLKGRSVDLVICTEGFVGAVKKCLADLGLLHFFTDVYGNVGKPFGETEYDKDLASKEPSLDEQTLLGSPSHTAWKPKAGLVRDLKAKRGLTRAEVVLVDDDPSEVHHSKDLCHVLWVQDREGMTVEDMEALQDISSKHLDAIRQHLALDPMFRESGKTPSIDADALIQDLQGMDAEGSEFKAAMRISHEVSDTEQVTSSTSAVPEQPPLIRQVSEYRKNFILSVFREWDANGDGQISKQELEIVLGKLGISRPVIDSMFVEADVNKDGWIDFVEFCNWLYDSEMGSVMLSAVKRPAGTSKAESEEPSKPTEKPISVGDLR